MRPEHPPVSVRHDGPLRIEHVSCIDSTNAELMRRRDLVVCADADATAGATAVACANAGSGADGEAACGDADRVVPAAGSGRPQRPACGPMPGGTTSPGPDVSFRPEAVWLIADEQMAGRGRRGKTWQALPGSALLASYGRELPAGAQHPLAAIPLVAGIVIAEHLDALGVELGLKWPNDLCCRQADVRQPWAKVGGILCEMRWRGDGSRLVIGVGLNLFDAPASLPPADPALNALPVASLFGRRPVNALQVPVDVLAADVGHALHLGVTQLLDEGFASFAARWAHFDMLAGSAIRVHHDGGTRDATAIGIDDAGRLLVRHDDAPGPIQALVAENVSIRPRRQG